MQIVIKISDTLKEILDSHDIMTASHPIWVAIMMDAIENGTPLPKGHGRMIDADETLDTAWQNFYKHEDEWEKKDENYLPIHRFYDQLGFECCQQTIVNAPTIIEADTESGDKE